MTSSLKKRNPPAYQEYASDWLANRNWRLMSLGERGLLDTLRKECWVNRSIPSNVVEIVKIFNLQEDEVSKCLTPRVLGFFSAVGDSLICPELEIYRENLNEQKLNMSKGGSSGGKATQRKRREEKEMLEASLEGMVKPLSKDEMRKEELSTGEVYQSGSSLTTQNSQDHKEWLDDWERT
jgi:hypothetical protein